MKAEVEVARVTQNLAREKVNADMVRAKAKGEADAQATILRGEAEAKAITAKVRALSENPHYIKLVEADKWNGIFPTTTLSPNAMPILNMNK